MIASIRLGSIDCARNATSDEAPKSIMMVRPPVSIMKHVLNRPPEPKASPDPTMVSFMSGLCAGPARNLGVPAPDMGEFLRNGEVGRLHEVDRDQTGYVGNGEVIAGHIELILQFTIHDAEELDDTRFVDLGPFGQLRGLQLLHGRVRVAEYIRYRRQEVELHAPVPHLDQRLFFRPAPEQRRLRPQALEVAADGHRLGNHGAVVEDENRHALQGIERGEFRRLLLLRGKIDLLHWYRDALFGEENPHAPRVGSSTAFVELHGVLPGRTFIAVRHASTVPQRRGGSSLPRGASMRRQGANQGEEPWWFQQRAAQRAEAC